MIEMKNVYKSFGKNNGRVEALRGVNLSIADGEMVSIMGKSGSGKSTLLNIIGGMMSFDSGEYIYDGKSIDYKNHKKLVELRRNDIGVVVQYFALAEDLNVYNNVALPLKYIGYSGRKVKNWSWKFWRNLEFRIKLRHIQMNFPVDISRELQ